MKNTKSIISLAYALAFLTSFSLAQALTISPVKMDLEGAPGQTIQGEIELYNEQSDTKLFYASYENFEPSGDSGSPHFVGGGSGLATWVSTEPSVTLLPDERKKIPFTITIPEDAEAGGYFAGVFFGGQKPVDQGSGEVAIGGKLGVLMLLRVAGDIDENGGLLSFMASGGRIFSQLPIAFSYKFNNEGGDRVVPLGDIVLTNTIGMTAATIPANVNGGSILPSSARTFTSTWNADGELASDAGFFDTVQYQFKNLHIGWYTARLSITWGMENNISTARYDFLIFPWQLVLAIVILGALGVVVLKQYNKMIVARARNARGS